MTSSNRPSGAVLCLALGFVGIAAPEQPVEVAYSVYDRLRHIHEAPLRNLRHSYWWVRKTFFTQPQSPTPAYLVDRTKPEIVRLFGRRYFEPGWELSYNYHGEVLNLRRVEHVDDGTYEWWQVHIRGFLHDEGIELTAHYETEPAEHPDAHVRLEGLDIGKGMDVVETILEEEEIEYRRLEPDERPGVTQEDVETSRRS
ncbi:MAG: hypothetical protein ACOCR0_00780 [Haloferacaceae archaeon]